MDTSDGDEGFLLTSSDSAVDAFASSGAPLCFDSVVPSRLPSTCNPGVDL